MEGSPSKISVREKLVHELRESSIITSYLFLCFAAEL